MKNFILVLAVSFASLSAFASSDCVNELGRVKASVTRQNNLLVEHFENAKKYISKASVATEALMQMSWDPHWNIGRQWISEYVSSPLRDTYDLNEEMMEKYPRNNESIQRAIQKLSDCLKNN